MTREEQKLQEFENKFTGWPDGYIKYLFMRHHIWNLKDKTLRKGVLILLETKYEQWHKKMNSINQLLKEKNYDDAIKLFEGETINRTKLKTKKNEI